jgi:hypothetical protein
VLGIPAAPDKQAKRQMIAIQQLPELIRRMRELEKQVAKSGDNEKFNEAVLRCDTNKDGMITETEAQIFASQFH